jgi:hypothetical protein
MKLCFKKNRYGHLVIVSAEGRVLYFEDRVRVQGIIAELPRKDQQDVTVGMMICTLISDEFFQTISEG